MNAVICFCCGVTGRGDRQSLTWTRRVFPPESRRRTNTQINFFDTKNQLMSPFYTFYSSTASWESGRASAELRESSVPPAELREKRVSLKVAELRWTLASSSPTAHCWPTGVRTNQRGAVIGEEGTDQWQRWKDGVGGASRGGRSVKPPERQATWPETNLSK